MTAESPGRLARSTSLRDHPELVAVVVIASVIALIAIRYLVVDRLGIDASTSYMAGAFVGLLIAQFIRRLCGWYGVE
ncbi:hypothetical protein [Natrinema soli]|uniref:Uncharacterized protein n=1 Tax=Natrinema soli TaxID=1930624 RepID=A0ABD5SV85_9EURY|nr:hypothetical protein [Natrinema soli]